MCSTSRVLICGAGPSGLSQLHAFESARQKGTAIPEIVCFEKQNDLGGQWNYSWRTGVDEYAEPVHSSMYHNLWANIPKECSEWVDYSFDQHFGQSITSFPPRSVLADYIRGYAKRNNVRQYIQFNMVVRWISYSDEKKRFSVLVKDLRQDQSRWEEFDYVVIATGHFCTPYVPHFDGIETFTGRLLHSHDFRYAREFADKHVLLIGNGSSGEDIALQLYKYNAKSVTISYRTKPKNYKWPETIKEVPLVTKIDGETAYFQDNSSAEIQAIIFCTGYSYSFPFLDDNLHLKTSSSLYPSNLYKSIIWINQPRLLYLAMGKLTLGFNVGNIQAWYARDYILGKITLPLTSNEIQSDIDQWQTKAKTIRNFAEYVRFHQEYLLDLLAASDYPRFDVERMGQVFMECVQTRFENMVTYREKSYPSTVTNTMAKQHHTPWLNEMDDSLENFI